MKSKIFAIIAIFTAIATTGFVSHRLNDIEKNKIIMETMMASLDQMHFEKHTLDNDFSEKVFKQFVENLDYRKIFLLQEDIDAMTKFKYKIDDEIQGKSFDLFYLAQDIYFKRIAEAEKYFQEALKKPFDFTTNEVIETDGEKLAYAKDKKELKERWRLLMKYTVMTKLATKLDVQEDSTVKIETDSVPKTFTELEEKSRADVLKTYNDWHHRLVKTDEHDLLSFYLNAIAAYFDPHTQYFPPEDKENFDISMSGKLEGIGATLSQANAYIKVEQIVPGSPCWKQGELEVGDLILKVAQASAEPVDVVDMRLDDAIKMIRGKKGTEVRLTVKKADGTIKIIPIVRDEVIIDETYAKSAIVKNPKTGERIGYIYLPKFYADFNDSKGRRCAKDIADEIKKLKQDNISGIVLDLRNNGGGSLTDVVDMVGLFIEQGPVVQVKARYAEPQVMRDSDKNVLYDGPLAVMVNEFSASASEILAAAVQDYGRGVIVGSTHTFGKGSVQRFVPFDQMVRGHDDIKPLGDLKITTQKFYRINGGTTQLEGVKSDIVLPDAYSKLDMGEKDLDNPLKWDEILRADYQKSALKIDFEALKRNSNQRVLADTSFQFVNSYADFMKQENDETTDVLNLEKYRAKQKVNSQKSKRYRNVLKRSSEFGFQALKADSATIYGDTIQTERFVRWQKELTKDIYIHETVKIVSEMK